MSAPRRLQRSRAKGARIPADAIYVGRPTRWGNPFRVGTAIDVTGTMDGPMVGRYDANDPRMYQFKFGVLDAAGAVLLYRTDLIMSLGDSLELNQALGVLRGRNLVCWCNLDEPCHADVLLELANRE